MPRASIRFAVPLLVLVLALAVACQSGEDDSDASAAPPATAPATTSAGTSTPATSAAAPPRDAQLSAVTTWAYQLQGFDGDDLELTALVASDVGLFVIDYSRNGDEEGAFALDEIAALQAGGRIVLAYMSIGEAESYRFYWDERWAPDGDPSDDAPDWAGPTNEAWQLQGALLGRRVAAPDPRLSRSRG